MTIAAQDLHDVADGLALISWDDFLKATPRHQIDFRHEQWGAFKADRLAFVMRRNASPGGYDVANELIRRGLEKLDTQRRHRQQGRIA